MNELSQQRGMTTIGLIFVLMLVGFFAVSVIRLAPSYLEYFSVASTLDSLAREPAITRKTKTDIRVLIIRRFGINNIKSISARDVRMEKRDGKLVLSVDYEIRTPWIANIDLIARFDKVVETPIR